MLQGFILEIETNIEGLEVANRTVVLNRGPTFGTAYDITTMREDTIG